MVPVALTIAGSDPSGGAGIQADLKTFGRFGVYGEAVITVLTVQNTHKLSRVEILPSDLVLQQIEAVISDVPPSAAKTGALGNAELVIAIAELAQHFTFPLIVDPVMVSKHGTRLVADDAAEALKRNLLPYAALVTPNIPEAEALTGSTIRTEKDMIAAGQRLIDFGCQAVLVKGGHREGEPADILCGSGYFERFSGNRIETRHTHGTGCTYSAAITAGLAQGLDLVNAIGRAKKFIQAAIETAPGLGSGHGPLNHFAEIACDRY